MSGRLCQCNTTVAYLLDEPEGVPVHGPCGSATGRTFAQGHDARLKGLLIRLVRAGQPYHYLSDGVLVSVDPRAEAERLGWSRFLPPLPPRRRSRSTKVAPGGSASAARPERKGRAPKK